MYYMFFMVRDQIKHLFLFLSFFFIKQEKSEGSSVTSVPGNLREIMNLMKLVV